MGEPLPVEQWRGAKVAMSSSEFEQRHPQLFLVWAPLATAPSGHASNGSQRVEFHTVAHTSLQNARTLRARASEAPNELAATELILPLIKGPENPFPDRISVGRAPNCDVVIRENSVSKLHGHFREVTLVSAVFTDAKSANGTRVNGVIAASGIPVALKSFDEIVFGRVRLQVMTPADLYRWL